MDKEEPLHETKFEGLLAVIEKLQLDVSFNMRPSHKAAGTLGSGGATSAAVDSFQEDLDCNFREVKSVRKL